MLGNRHQLCGCYGTQIHARLPCKVGTSSQSDQRVMISYDEISLNYPSHAELTTRRKHARRDELRYGDQLSRRNLLQERHILQYRSQRASPFWCPLVLRRLEEITPLLINHLNV